MELKYFEGQQQIQREAILESVTDHMLLAVADKLRLADEEAKRTPRVHVPITLYVPKYKGVATMRYTVVCE